MLASTAIPSTSPSCKSSSQTLRSHSTIVYLISLLLKKLYLDQSLHKRLTKTVPFPRPNSPSKILKCVTARELFLPTTETDVFIRTVRTAPLVELTGTKPNFWTHANEPSTPSVRCHLSQMHPKLESISYGFSFASLSVFQFPKKPSAIFIHIQSDPFWRWFIVVSYGLYIFNPDILTKAKAFANQTGNMLSGMSWNVTMLCFTITTSNHFLIDP